ncbi:2,3-bisphosphoglycerate-dependent phosphoglycerate mutase [Weissella fangxianensis]|uniref:2,3-bisphosphoglycerate-dependent phosphoglycerate mutase n=1 Tax=Weissella fangxianensis TaxID=2953879 RepID=UPI002157DE81|nr:2,3-bisphosphoglycerate-dependent phosphoglycerate mutase [Weissella fangxianensis]
MVKLILMRHGESTANMHNTFTGWTDAALTDKGRVQAKAAGQLLKKEHIEIDDVHTSFLKRTIMTAYIVCDELMINWIPIFKTWRLNERHYGALAGLDKDEARHQFGKQQVERWRRGFKDLPPQLSVRDHQPAYDRIGVDVPLSESLEMTLTRVRAYWDKNVAPRLRAGNNELIVAHGSSLRVLVKYLDQVSDDELDQIAVPNAKPIVYTLDDHLQVIHKQVFD